MPEHGAVREALTGPIASIRTPFTRDGDIDFDGLRRYAEFVIDAGSRTLLLTYGDSLYSTLTDDEVLNVTRRLVEFAAGRAFVVAADRQWWTGRTVEFAHDVRQVGADVLMVLPPDWAASCTPESMVKHYAAVAREIPVMLVTNLFIRRSADFGLEVIRRALDVPGIVAVKDDFGGAFARRLCLLAKERWAVFSGGQKQNHLNMYPYGCDGYLSTFITFRPEVAWRYWNAIQAGNTNAAVDVIQRWDMPLFDFVCGQTGGFDACFHGILELTGIAGRWRRAPYHSVTDAQLDRIAEFLESLPSCSPDS